MGGCLILAAIVSMFHFPEPVHIKTDTNLKPSLYHVYSFDGPAHKTLAVTFQPVGYLFGRYHPAQPYGSPCTN
jgi:hypothetical protein